MRKCHSLSPHFSGLCLAAFSPWPRLSFNKYLLNTCYLPDNVLGPEDTAVCKTDKTPTPVELTFYLNPTSYLLYLRGRDMLSCCSPEGLVSKKRSAHVCALHARGPFPWRKRSISLEWPKRLLGAQFCRGNSPPPMRILSFDSQNHPTEQILIYPFYK